MKMESAVKSHRAGRKWLFPARGLGFLGFALCATLNLAAQNGRAQDGPVQDGRAQDAQIQEGSSARIYHAEGVDFSLSLGGERTIFPAEAAGGGVNLERSGIVSTGAGTFLEIQLVPSGTVIKLSENTSLIYNGIDGNGKFADLGLLYGRIRLVTGSGTNSAGTYSAGMYSVVIRCEGISARIKQGDFGLDYILDPGNRNPSPRPLFRLYAFRGGAEVFSYGQGGSPVSFGGARSLTVEGGGCLSLDVSPSYTYAERKPLGRDISDYWRLHNFAGYPPLSLPDTAIAAASEGSSPGSAGETGPGNANSPSTVRSPGTAEAAVPDQLAGTVREQGSTKSNPNKQAALITGLILTASSLAVQGFCYSQLGTSNDARARSYYTAAYVPLGVGLASILAGILFNPPPASR